MITTRSARMALALALLLPITAALAAGPEASAAPPRDVPCGQIERAPVLNDDKTAKGKAIVQRADRRGVYVPIIMVPDWHGRATHDKSRTGDFSARLDMGAGGPAPDKARASLIGTLQQVPGAAVYTFDYRASAGRWVDDPGIGPALGDAIDCVTAALGQKAILITHGTGGVAARYAVGGVVAGRDRGASVTTVIGYGSPQGGVQLADLLNPGVGSTASEPRTVTRLLLGACGALKPATFAAQAPCEFLPAAAAAFGQPGSEAFRAGSPQQNQLRPYPASVRGHSFAGEVTVKATGLGWFGLRPFRADAVALGDLVSSTAASTIGASSQLRASCRFTLGAYGRSTQSAGIRLGDDGLPPPALPWVSTPRPCFAASLTRVAQFADRLVEILNVEIRNRQPLDLRELESLAVPSICGHPAGSLVGGRLPGIAAGQGEVVLASTAFPDRFKDFTTFGDLTRDGVADTVVVLKCSGAEGVGADVVAAYDSGARLLGSINLADVTDRALNEVYRVRVAGGRALMQWRTTRDTDAFGAPSLDASATFTYSESEGLQPGFLRSFNETIPVADLIKAVRKGKINKTAAKIASIAVFDAMVATDQSVSLGDVTCYGPYPADIGWPARAVEDFGDMWPPSDGLEHGDRYCLIALGEGERFALLGMLHTGFSTWRAVEFRLPEEGTGDTGGGILDPGGDDDDGGIIGPIL
ncbi:MAG: esterase/lipase family protein [Sporichthyaceae bacterium]